MTIKKIRKIMGLTQEKMAALMGMPQPSIARIESGKRQETKQHIATLKLLLLLYLHGLLREAQNGCQE